MLQRIIRLNLRLSPLLLLQRLQLPTSVLHINLFVINRHEHLLHTSQIRVPIFLKAVSDECAAGVFACEEVIAAAWSVVSSSGGDVVDGSVDGEVDGLGWVAAIVGFEVGVCECLRTGLE